MEMEDIKSRFVEVLASSCADLHKLEELCKALCQCEDVLPPHLLKKGHECGSSIRTFGELATNGLKNVQRDLARCVKWSLDGGIDEAEVEKRYWDARDVLVKEGVVRFEEDVVRLISQPEKRQFEIVHALMSAMAQREVFRMQKAKACKKSS
jgi:hypothetical protein